MDRIDATLDQARHLLARYQLHGKLEHLDQAIEALSGLLPCDAGDENDPEDHR